jgi:pilus assembly protein CpaB
MPLPSLRRKLPRSSIVWFIVAGGLALAAFAIVRGEAARAERARLAVGPAMQIVVAAHDLSAGTVLTPADVRLDEIPGIFAPPGAVTSVGDAVDLVSVATVTAGEPLVRSRLATSAFATSVTPGNVVVTVAFASVPGGFSPADRVDAYATYAGARPYTTLVGEDLHVLAVGDTTASSGGPSLTSVTLDVDGETARQLLQASASAVLGLAARAATVVTATPSASPGWSPPPG